jgi:hypothetical protein
MYSLSTLSALNEKEVKSYYLRHPLKRILVPSDVKRSPDYSGSSVSELARKNKMILHETYFVDSSGFGSSNEPAYTYPAFERIIEALLKDNPSRQYFCALTGIGQFQVYVSIFYRREKV